MKVQVEELSPIKKKLIIEVEAEQIRKEWESVVKTFNKKVKLKGFRPGKIPVTVLIKFYGPQIEEEVVSQDNQSDLPGSPERDRGHADRLAGIGLSCPG